MIGAELMVRCLENEGVEYIFGVPGEETLDLNNALLDSKIRFITVRHEQGAAFMADVYGRLTGRAGVCLATLGPGATNLATGLADANLDRAPVVAITGQVSRDRMHKESHQFVDILKAFAPLTKWNSRVETGAIIPEVVRKAFKLAQEEKPGACLIELPEDVAEEPADGEPLGADRARRPSPDRPSLARAADLLNAASRPLILAGNGVIRGHASEALRHLAERAGIPVVNTFMAKGVLPADHPLALTTVGLAQGDYERAGFGEADLVVAVGYDPVEYGPRTWNPNRQAQIVHIDFTSAEVDAHYQPAVQVVADIREALDLLAGLIAAADRQPPRRPGRDDRRRADAFPLFPERVLADLEAALAPEDLVISDVGAHKLWLARFFGARLPQHGHHLQRLRGDGGRAARGNRRQNGVPRTARRGGVGGRGLPHERPGAGDRQAVGPSGRRPDLSRQRLRIDSMEAGAALPTYGGRRVWQSGLRPPRGGLRLSRVSRRFRGSAASHLARGLHTARSHGHRLSRGLPGEQPAPGDVRFA